MKGTTRLRAAGVLSRLMKKCIGLFACHSREGGNPVFPGPWIPRSSRGMTNRGLLRHPACGSAAGFTLLELMISFAIIGVIAAIMAGALRLGFQTVERGEKKIEALERLRSSISIMDSQIQSFIPITFDDQGERRFFFSGSREELEFSTNYSIWGGEKGYVVTRYSVETDGNGKKSIAVKEHTVGSEASREARLFNPMDDIYFEYFFKEPTDEKGSWTEEWTEKTSTPQKIRVHLVEGARDIAWIAPVRAVGTLAQPAASRPDSLFPLRKP